MRVKVLNKEKSGHKEDLEAYLLTYDCTADTFEMQVRAISSGPISPLSQFVYTASGLHCSSLKKADTDAKHSFRHMLD